MFANFNVVILYFYVHLYLWVIVRDRRHMEILGIKIGEILTWSKAVKRIRKKMSLEKFDYACEECNWQPYGMCRSALLTHSK